jgi:hypothetical protein
VVRIISLQDLLGNYIKNDDTTKYITRSPAVRVDNTPPKCDYDRTEDNRDWTNGSGSPIKKTRVFAILCNDSDRSGSTTSVNQSGCVVHNASSDDMTLTSYYASNPKGVYWGAYVWRSPDSGADYAYSSAIRNSDATRADYGRNISYGETISDRVGNTTVCTNFPTKKVNLDTTPPVCGKLTSTNGSWNNVKGHWTRQNMTISVGCTDLGADSKLKKENTSTCTQNPFTKYFNYSVTTSDIEIADYADNKVKCPMNVYLDVDYPVISFSPNGTNFPNGYPSDSNSGFNVGISCSDSGSVQSGISSYNPHSFSISSPTSSSGDSNTVTCTDIAGNGTTITRTYYVRHYYKENCGKCGGYSGTDGNVCGWRACYNYACGTVYQTCTRQNGTFTKIYNSGPNSPCPIYNPNGRSDCSFNYYQSGGDCMVSATCPNYENYNCNPSPAYCGHSSVCGPNPPCENCAAFGSKSCWSY